MKKSFRLPRVRLQLFSLVLAQESDIGFPSSTYTEVGVGVGEFIARAFIKLSNQIGSSKPIILL